MNVDWLEKVAGSWVGFPCSCPPRHTYPGALSGCVLGVRLGHTVKGPAGPLSDTSSLAELARKPVVDEVQMKVLPAASNAAGAS